MIVDEDVYLEHVGVKGMRWGIRRDPKTGIRPIANTLDKSKFGRIANANAQRHMRKQESKKSKKPMSQRDKLIRQEKIIKNLSRIATIAAGALYVAALVSSSSGSTRVNNIKVNKPQSVTDIINSRRNVEVNSLKRMHKEGKMDAQQAEKFLKILNNRYDRKIADALKG